MTDREVEELLEDLDRVLAIEASPTVAARVRIGMTQAPASTWFRLRRYLAVAAAGVIVSAIAYVGRPHPLTVQAPGVPMATRPIVRSAQEPSLAAKPMPIARRSPVAPVGGVVAQGEALPVISPDRRVALRQLVAAVDEGRLNADSLVAHNAPTVPEPLIATPVVIEPFEPDTVPLTRAVEVGVRPGR